MINYAKHIIVFVIILLGIPVFISLADNVNEYRDQMGHVKAAMQISEEHHKVLTEFAFCWDGSDKGVGRCHQRVADLLNDFGSEEVSTILMDAGFDRHG